MYLHFCENENSNDFYMKLERHPNHLGCKFFTLLFLNSIIILLFIKAISLLWPANINNTFNWRVLSILNMAEVSPSIKPYMKTGSLTLYKIPETAKHIAQQLHSIDSTLVTPGRTFNLALGVMPIPDNINIPQWDILLNSLVDSVTKHPQLLRNIKSISGNNWIQEIKETFLFELYMVTCFLEWNSSLPYPVSITNYSAYISSNLTVGAARLLMLAFKQRDLFDLGYQYGRLTVDYNVGLNSENIKKWAQANYNISELAFPVINKTTGFCRLPEKHDYILNCFKAAYPSTFAYKQWLIEDFSPMNISIGDYIYNGSFDENFQSGILATCVKSAKQDIALNIIYGTYCLNDPLIAGQTLWRYSTRKPFFQEFSDFYLEVWTGLKFNSNLALIELSSSHVTENLPPITGYSDSESGKLGPNVNNPGTVPPGPNVNYKPYSGSKSNRKNAAFDSAVSTATNLVADLLLNQVASSVNAATGSDILRTNYDKETKTVSLITPVGTSKINLNNIRRISPLK